MFQLLGLAAPVTDDGHDYKDHQKQRKDGGNGPGDKQGQTVFASHQAAAVVQFDSGAQICSRGGGADSAGGRRSLFRTAD